MADNKKPYVNITKDDAVELADLYKRLSSVYDRISQYEGHADADIKRKRIKRETDPNRPKKPMSAYFIFSRENYPIVKREHADWKQPDISKHLGTMWSNLTDKDKKPYMEVSDEYKKKYDAALAAYQESHDANHIAVADHGSDEESASEASTDESDSDSEDMKVPAKPKAEVKVKKPAPLAVKLDDKSLVQPKKPAVIVSPREHTANDVHDFATPKKKKKKHNHDDHHHHYSSHGESSKKKKKKIKEME